MGKYFKRFANWILRTQNKPNKYTYLGTQPGSIKGKIAAILFKELDISDTRIDGCADQLKHLFDTLD